MSDTSSATQCPICLEQFGSEGDHTPYVRTCGHSFCYSCTQIIEFVHNSKECPTCRQTTDEPAKPNFALRDALSALPDLDAPASSHTESVSLFVADSKNHRVQVLRADGEDSVRSIVGDGQFALDTPHDVAISSDGLIYVADWGKSRVVVFDQQNGNAIRSFGGPGTGHGQFSLPTGITFGTDDTLYVSDTGNNRVQQLTTDGDFVRSFGAEVEKPMEGSGEWVVLDETDPNDRNPQLEAPRHCALSTDNKLFVCDTGNHQIVVFDTHGCMVHKFGSAGSADGQFQLPVAIALDTKGLVYVAEWDNNRVQVLDQQGGFIRFIGQEEKLQSPSGVAVSPNGHVYVSEWDKNRMSVFDPEGSFVEAIDCDRDNQFKGPFGIALGRGAANT